MLGVNKYIVRAGARNSLFYSTFCFYCLQINDISLVYQLAAILFVAVIFAFLEVWMSCFIPKNRYGFSFSCDGAV